MRRVERGTWLSILVVVMVAVAGVGCGGGADAPASRRTLTVASEQMPSSLNHLHGAHSAFGTALFMDGLIWPQVTVMQPDGSIETNTDLVEIELVSEDPQTIEYRINERAVWSDGEPISADDFVFTYEAQNGAPGDQVDPHTGEALPRYNAASTSGYDVMGSVTAVNDKTVRVVFNDRYADWRLLFNPVIPRHAFVAEGGGDPVKGFNEGFVYPDVDLSNVVSGGPMVVARVQGQTTLTLGRNDRYWGRKPALDRITIRWIADGSQHPTAMANREADVAFPQAQIDLVRQARRIPGLETFVGFGTLWEHMDFNLNNVHLAKAEVRRAIGKALDRAQIVERLTKQFDPKARVLNNRIFYPGNAHYQDNGGKDYGKVDVAAAERLLEGAGYRKGGGGVYTHPTDGRLSIRLTWRTPNPRREQTAELVLGHLEAAGVDAELAPKSDFTFLENRDFDIALFGWSGITSLSAHSDIYRTKGGSNVGDYSNTEVDELLAAADGELDEGKRADILNRVDRILWEDLPTLPLFQVPEFLVWREEVANVVYNGYEGSMIHAPSWRVRR